MNKDNDEYAILLIEDNQGDFILVEDFLFEQITAPVITHVKDYKTSEEVLKSGKGFDVVLLDLSLPDKTGEDLIKKIVEICLNMPIIVLTGYADFSFGVKSLSLGVSDYLLKDEITAITLYKSIIYSIERKRAMLDLVESKKRYSELFHLNPLPMYVVDPTSLKFLDVNTAAINHYGYTRDELLSMTIKDIRPAEAIPMLERGLEEGRRNPDALLRSITLHKKKNGEITNVDVQIAQMLYKEKKANMVIATDITERTSYIKAIENQNEQLKEISWIQSHIIRAPLSRIMGLIPLIKQYDDEMELILDYITQSANELDEVIKDITDKTTIAKYQFPVNS